VATLAANTGAAAKWPAAIASRTAAKVAAAIEGMSAGVTTQPVASREAPTPQAIE
jgi:hypothetical protein